MPDEATDAVSIPVIEDDGGTNGVESSPVTPVEIISVRVVFSDVARGEEMGTRLEVMGGSRLFELVLTEPLQWPGLDLDLPEEDPRG